jgi:riboflavin kinase/FMN adenylyltransferase
MIATTGFFDGVHLGHRAVLQRVVDWALEQGEESAVVTFWPHPRVVLHQEAEKVRLLNALDEKKWRLQQLGIKHVLVLPFTLELAQLSPETFFEKYLHREYRLKGLVVGYDHHLGNNAGADYHQLKAIGAAMNIPVECVRAVACAEEEAACETAAVSSTKIRAALQNGNVNRANHCLGYHYLLQGTVVEGQHLGREMGFPTANMQLNEPLKQLPKNGVYVTRVSVQDKLYLGMTNIGHRPTMTHGMHSRTIETHILGFSDTIYDQEFTIEFLARIRDERRFDSVEDLIHQLQLDKDASLSFMPAVQSMCR